jgi:hypothetical protein
MERSKPAEHKLDLFPVELDSIWLTNLLQVVTKASTADAGTIYQQLVCPNPNLCIGDPAPLTTPSIIGLNNLEKITSLSSAESLLNNYTYSMACQGENANYTQCTRGCTNSQALSYNPQARIDNNSCRNDPLVILTWIDNNLSWIIALFVIVVCSIILLGLSGAILCMYCCCCRTAGKCCYYKQMEPKEVPCSSP